MPKLKNLRKKLEKNPIEASAPCRVDIGGTLDIAPFLYPLYDYSPCTFNIAIDLRTRVQLTAYRDDRVKISSRGFETATFSAGKAPFNHPLGLMFAVAAHFGVSGVHIDIQSSSPPRSSLGGSSVAAAALVAALLAATHHQTPVINADFRKRVALLAHALEESVAGVLCGKQDQLAAVFGGVNSWYWHPGITRPGFKRQPVVRKSALNNLQRHLLLAYCGIPHESKQVNATWIKQFIEGRFRDNWLDIIYSTKKFIDAVKSNNYKEAAIWMNREAHLRRQMTPAVFDEMGEKLATAGRDSGCGVRFAGAGGGGCVWAVGETKNIDRLRGLWEDQLKNCNGAFLLDFGIDTDGLRLRHGNPS